MSDIDLIYQLISLRQRGTITRQQAQILDELQRQRRRLEKQDSLPDCPFCGHPLPKHDVGICASCGAPLVWHGKQPFRTVAEAERFAKCEAVKLHTKQRVRQLIGDLLQKNPNATSEEATQLLERRGINVAQLPPGEVDFVLCLQRPRKSSDTNGSGCSTAAALICVTLMVGSGLAFLILG